MTPCGTQCSVGQNLCAQTAAAFKELFRAGRDRPIHPIAWPAFGGAVKADPLDFKFLADQLVKIDIAREDVAPQQ